MMSSQIQTVSCYKSDNVSHYLSGDSTCFIGRSDEGQLTATDLRSTDNYQQLNGRLVVNCLLSLTWWLTPSGRHTSDSHADIVSRLSKNRICHLGTHEFLLPKQFSLHKSFYMQLIYWKGKVLLWLKKQN